MAYLKLQGLTSLEIAPSDDAPIPVPTSPHFDGVGIVGTGVPATNLVGNTLLESGTTAPPSGTVQGENINAGILLGDAAADFPAAGVQPRDVFVNTTAGKVDPSGNQIEGSVKNVIGTRELLLEAEPYAPLTNTAPLIEIGDTYELYSANNFEDVCKIGDIVVNTTAGADYLKSTTISEITDKAILTLTTDIGLVATSTYRIYTSPTENIGCIIYVGGTGDITCVTASGQTVLYSAVPQGIWMPVQVKQVLETGTTATLLVANW